jgi:hypothetical protein
MLCHENNDEYHSSLFAKMLPSILQNIFTMKKTFSIALAFVIAFTLPQLSKSQITLLENKKKEVDTIGTIKTVDVHFVNWAQLPNDQTNLLADHTGGDLEFAGHGPTIDLTGNLRIINIDKGADQLEYRLKILFRETNGGDSKAKMDIWNILYTAPEGWEIMKIDGPENIKNWMKTYHDESVQDDIIMTPWGAIVLRGDTYGTDILHRTGIKYTLFNYIIHLKINRIK